MKENYQQLEFDLMKEAVAKYCSFSLGKSYILNETPHFSKLWVDRELTRGKEALQLYEVYRSPAFAGVSDISDTLKIIMKGGVADARSLYAISRFSNAVTSVLSYLKQSELATPEIQDLCYGLNEQRPIVNAIANAILPSYEIKDTASPSLKGIRRSIRDCEANITKETQTLISRYSGALMENITAIRNNRTCILVKASEKNKIRGFIHGESASGQAVYIEPEILVRLNNTLQSLKSQEEEEVYRILKELSALVKPQCHSYFADLDTMTIVDALFAKATWAYERQGVYADVKENGRLYFKDARHPLIDPDKVVSNTYEIKEPYHHLLITGSNTGGKTVTLKTIGLFTVLTYAGFPILCESAQLPLLDGVYVDIGDQQSIVESLSTFSAHLSKLATIADHASSHSMVLLDELGSGTDPNEGECLAIAVLDYFRKKDIMCIATTHYSRLKEYAKKQEDILLSSVSFDMEKMMPTYHYLEGYSGSSNALEIARRYHLKEAIINEAYQLKEAGKGENERLIEKLDQERMRLAQQAEQLQQHQKAINDKQQLLDEQEKKWQREKQAILEAAQKEAEKIREEAKVQAEMIIEELKGMKQRSVKDHELIALKTMLKEEAKEEPIREAKSNHSFQVNDYVKLVKLGYHGEIISLKGNRATVFANGMKMNVKTSDLEPTQRPRKAKTVKSISSRRTTSSARMECNLIGMHVEEALFVVDKYLDTCLLNHVYQVRLIHGMGTGALRKGIHQYLKKNKNVESFRMGGEGEGGVGATVVTLKHGEKNG